MIEEANQEENTIAIYGQELSPAVPALARFALEFTAGRDCPGHFVLFFRSVTGQSHRIMGGDVYERDGIHEFSPHDHENRDGSVVPHDQRLLRLLEVFSDAANARHKRACAEIDQALDEIGTVRSWGTV